jgi:hypothetical protein
MATAPETVLEAIKWLEAEGYTASFEIVDGVHCGECHTTHPYERVLVDRVYRLEGASDPDEQAIVLGARCPNCAERGIIVSGYGPSADPEVIDGITLLQERFKNAGVT